MMVEGDKQFSTKINVWYHTYRSYKHQHALTKKKLLYEALILYIRYNEGGKDNLQEDDGGSAKDYKKRRKRQEKKVY